MSKRRSSVTRRAAFAGVAAALATSAVGGASKVASANSTAETRAVLDRAVEAFFNGWATGDWEPFLSMLADDFIFQFPSGPHRGRRAGRDGRRKMVVWAREHGSKNNRITRSVIDLRLYNDDWVIVCDRGTGNIGGRPYEGLHAIFMKAGGGKIVEYREYFGDLPD